MARSRTMGCACLASALSLASALMLAELSTARADEVGARISSVIHGEDDRVEAENDARAAVTVALVASDRLSAAGDLFAFDAATLGETIAAREGAPLCEGERFSDQPSLASCTGVLVTPDSVLTAAHCMRSLSCDRTSLVFDFRYESELPPIQTDAVFFCRRVLAIDDRLDIALLEMDRRTERPVANLSLDVPQVGSQLSIVGHPGGVPMKLAPRATASVRIDPGSFILFADAFAGNSGSPVFDEGGALVGLLNRGVPDYERAGECTAAVRFAETEGAGTVAARLDRTLGAVCEDAPDSDACRLLPSGCSVSQAGSGSWLIWALALAWASRRLG